MKQEMDYKGLIEELRFLSSHVPGDMCDDDGRDALEKAATAIETLLAEREEAKWINVKDRLPEKQCWCHVAILDKKTGKSSVENDLFAVETAKNFGHEIGFCKDDRWEGREVVTHWMPYPEPPSEEA